MNPSETSVQSRPRGESLLDHSPHYDWRFMDFTVDDYFKTDDHLQRLLDVEHRSPTAARLRLHALGGSGYGLSFPQNTSLFLIFLKEIYKLKTHAAYR